MENKDLANNFREIIFYKTADGNVKVEILLKDENLWLTQAKMAELFEVQKLLKNQKKMVFLWMNILN